MPRVLILALFLTSLALAESDPALEAIKRLQAEAATPGADVTTLRRKLRDLRREYPGTEAAVRAAEILARLPSPLDVLDSANIPTLERFPTQPKQLVAVLGDHRGRHSYPVASVAFSSDGQRLASGGGYRVRIWDGPTMRLIGAGIAGGTINSVAWSKDGSRVACGIAQGAMSVYETEPKDGVLKQLHSVNVATSGVRGVAFHPNGVHVAVAAGDGPVRVYDVSGTKAEEVASATGHKGIVHAVAYSPDGKWLASAGADQTVRLWEPGTPECKEKSRIESVTSPATALTFNASGKTLAVGYTDGSVRLWTTPPAARPKTPRATFVAGRGAVTGLSYSSSGLTLAVANGDNGTHLIAAAATPKLKAKAEGHEGPARCVALSPDGKTLASGGDDWMVRTFDLTKPKPAERFVTAAHLASVSAVALAPDGRALASGSQDKTVRPWDLSGAGFKSGKPLKGENVPITSVAYSPDGKFLAASGLSTKVRQWEAATFKIRTSLVRHTEFVQQVAYSPDGKWLLTRNGKEVLVCDPLTGGIEASMATHKTRVHHASWSSDARTIATVSGEYERDEMGRYVIKDGKYVPLDCMLRLFEVGKQEECATWGKFDKSPLQAIWRAGKSDLMVVEGAYTVAGFITTEKDIKPSAPWASRALNLLPCTDGKSAVGLIGWSMPARWDMTTGKMVESWSLPENVTSLAVTDDGRYLVTGLDTGVIYILRLQALKSAD